MLLFKGLIKWLWEPALPADMQAAPEKDASQVEGITAPVLQEPGDEEAGLDKMAGAFDGDAFFCQILRRHTSLDHKKPPASSSQFIPHFNITCNSHYPSYVIST